MNFKIYVLGVLFILIFSVSVVSASDDCDNLTVEVRDAIGVNVYQNENVDLDNNVSQIEDRELKTTNNDDDDVVVVNDWDELQYYCAQTDKDYTLKLKENTNFYPTNPNDANYQIKIKNNVKIIGGNGSYIGDASSNARGVDYSLFVVESNVKCAMHLENITFKWTEPMKNYHSHQIIQISGRNKYTSILKNCLFDHIGTTSSMYDYLITMGSGNAILDNCSFVNCWSTEGLIRVTDSKMNKTTHMILENCYFAYNHAAIAPGCVYNSGILDVINSSFINNGAGYWAGAVHTAGYGNTSIYDSYFKDNVAGWNGGALYTYAYLQLYNTTFINNHCTANNGGGAIGACQYISTPHIYVEGCLFQENENNCWSLDGLSTTGTGRGGAISFMDEGSLEVRDTTFIANVASIGSAICAWAMEGYGSPNIIIVNNSFINQTRAGDPLNVYVSGTPAIVSDNYYYGNSIVFSNLTLTKLDEGNEQATFKITNTLSHPSYYDSDILDKTLYDVYINNKYVKTVDSTVFTIDFDDLDICNVYVIPTISNQKSNPVTAVSTREYIFVSKSHGNDSNNGISRDTPVNTIKRALELANIRKNIILLDGDYSEGDVQIGYGVTIKGEGNSTLTGAASFVSDANFTLKNLKINNLNTEYFIKQNKNSLVVSNCVFTNNDALLVYNNGFVSLTNSVLLNNSKIVDGNIDDCVLDYNWWGDVPSDLSNYVTLNITSNLDSLENNQKADVKVGFYLNDGSRYTKLPDISFDVTAFNGVSSQSTVNVDSSLVYTLTAFDDGVLTVSYNNVNVSKSFEFLKSNPGISLSSDDVMFGDDVVVSVTTPGDAEGNLTVSVGNQSQSKVIQSAKTIFTFENLKADTYTIALTYTGDKKYLTRDLTGSVDVSKYESTTQLDLSAVNVGEDVIITITTVNTSTGNVTLSVNDDIEILTLTGSKAEYVIKNIKRGDYLIRAVYNGDDKYLSSQDSKFIEVDNLNATISIKADDITYGDVAVIRVNLDDDATGNVTVTVDGVSKQSGVSDGRAEVSFANLNAGFKNISVFYTGDDTYFNLTKTGAFNIAKTDLIFTIASEDIKIGQLAEISITVPQRTSGTFTIGEDIINIPLTGEISYVISDLEIGNYTYTATYNGNNYYTVSNSTSFTVSEYPIPQVQNEGSNTENTHKSQYETSTNGNIAFTIPFNEALSGDLVIDSFGNVYLPTQSGVHAFNRTSQLWYFTSSDAAGNFSGIAISRDVIIASKSGDTLYFINQTTGERWGESNIYQGSSLFAPVVDGDATVYVASEYQTNSEDYKLTIIPYKIWNDGYPTLIDLGKSQTLCSPVLNDNIVVVLSDNRLRIIDAKTLQTLSIKSGNYMPVRPVIGEGNIVYAVLSDGVVAYNADGLQVWSTRVSGGVGNILALDNNQGLYHVNSRGVLYRYDLADGSQFKFSSLKVTSGILIDANSNLYFASNNIFYALDSEGNILWKSDLGYKIVGNPVMDASGLIYVPTENGITALTYASLRDAINVTVEDIFIGETAEVIISADSQIVNKFTYTVNGETNTSDGGLINMSLSDLVAGNYTVVVSYDGDERFASQNVVRVFEVKKYAPVKNVTVEDIFVGETAEIIISTDSQIKNNLIFTVNGETYVRDGGLINVSLSDLVAGNYTVVVSYGGDERFASQNVVMVFKVKKHPSELTASVENITFGETLEIKINTDADGLIYTVVNGNNYTAKNNCITIPNLKADNYTVSVVYAGNDKYESITKQVKFTVSKVSVSLDNILNISDDNTTFTVKLDDGATGSLTVSVDNNVIKSSVVSGGFAEVVIPKLSEGSHNVQITYSGDDNYLPSTKSIVLTGEATPVENTTKPVDNTTKPVENTTNSSDINQSGGVPDDAFIIPEDGSEYSISLPSDATGTLTVTVDGISYSGELVNGKATVNIPELGEGSHNITIMYSGDSNYPSVTKNKVVVKDPVNSTGDDNSTSGNGTAQPVSDDAFIIPEDGSEYSISLPGDATGTLTVTVDGKVYSQELINGKATVSVPELGEGSHNITVTYSGDGKYSPASKSSVVVIGPVNSTVDDNSTLENNTGDNNSTAGNGTAQPVSDDAFIIPEDGSEYSISLPSDARGTLTVTVDGISYAAALVDGKATVNIPELGEGSHNITVTYSGDGKYASMTKSSVVVKEHVPVIKLTGSNLSMLYTSGKYFKVRLTSDGKALANKKVKIKINGKTYTRTTDKNGYASIKIKLPPKAYTVKATYGSLKLTKKVTVKTVISAKNINTKKSAKTVKIKVTLKKVNKKYLKNKKVTLKFNKKTFKAKTNKKGVVTFTIKKNVYNKLKVNKKYTYQVIYGKDKVKKTIKFKK